jgi:hypothetical protein
MIVSLDDDILSLDKLSGSGNELIKVKNIDSLFKQCFTIAYKNGSRLWGVYPVYNAFFMKSKTHPKGVTHDLRFIVGTIFGKINDHSIMLTIDEKDDFEQTLMYYKKDNSITRFNYITIKTKYYSTKGGLNTSVNDRTKRLAERKEEHKKSAEYLHKKYPNLTKVYDKKKSGFVEVKLIK